MQLTIPNAESLPPSFLSNIHDGFKDAFEQAEKWREQALAIRVTSLDQKAEMKLARTIRLELKNIRVNAEKKRKALKEDSLKLGRAIDGVNNLLIAAIEPLERHLQEQEDFVARLEKERLAKLAADRAELLAPYILAGSVIPQLEALTEEQWEAYFADTKLLHTAKIEAERKAEAERIAREQAEAAERERIRLENEKLKAERAEMEAKAKAEREAREKAEREAAEAARKEREEAERKLQAERAAAAERQRIADEAARKEREAREKAERDLADARAAEEARAKAEEAAKKKAARAPDKEKAKSFAATVRNLKTPEASTPEGAAVMAEIAAKAEGFAKWIEAQAERL